MCHRSDPRYTLCIRIEYTMCCHDGGQFVHCIRCLAAAGYNIVYAFFSFGIRQCGEMMM